MATITTSPDSDLFGQPTQPSTSPSSLLNNVMPGGLTGATGLLGSGTAPAAAANAAIANTNFLTTTLPSAPTAQVLSSPTPQETIQVPTTAPQTPTPVNLEPFTQQFIQAAEPNVLNTFFQPTYHFRLFVIGDQDPLGQAKTASNQNAQGKDLLAAFANIPQITIAESGVTGYSIKDVEIDSVSAESGTTEYQSVNNITMTVIDPLGVSFLDALYAAAAEMKVANWNKGLYHLQLTFKGYDESGNINTAISCDGQSQWIWSLCLTTIDTKINEGGGVFTLHFVNSEDSGLVANGRDQATTFITPAQGLTVQGSTVKEIFADLIQKANAAWTQHFNALSDKTNQTLVVFDAIQTNPIQFGPSIGQDPGNFVLTAKQPYMSSQRTEVVGGSGKQMVTCQIPPLTSINKFIISTINATEQGQMLAICTTDPSKVDTSATQTNSRNVRESTMFSVEPRVKVPDQNGFDTKSNNYIKHVTFNVAARLSQEAILSHVQRDAANSSNGQQAMITSLLSNGFLRKQYEYIYTGRNTEVLDLSIEWNMAYQAILSNMAGSRMTFDNVARNALLNPVNQNLASLSPDSITQLSTSPVQLSNPPTATPIIASTTPAIPLTQQPTLVSMTQATVNPITGTTVPANVLSTASPLNSSVTSSLTSSLNSSLNPGTGPVSSLASMVAATLTQTATPVVTKPQTPEVAGGTNTYIENEIYQATQTSATGMLPVPVSFWYGNTDLEAGQGLTGQYGPGLSIVGSVFRQVDNSPLTGSFIHLDMTIRGDPFWVGQTNLQRQIVSDSKQPTYDKTALPDYASGDQVIFVRFLYPLSVNDTTFEPTLKPSECFEGLYTVVSVKNTFSDGVFKQILACQRLPLINVTQALAAQPPTATNGGSGSSPQSNQPSTPATSTGTTPGQTAGTANPNAPVGIQNNNPTNLTYHSGQPNVTGQNGAFGTYPSTQDGIAAATNQLLLNQNQHGLTTVAQQISTWAPASAGNPTSGYINNVANTIGVGSGQTIDVSNPGTGVPMLTGMIKQEVGASAASQISQATITAGYNQGLASYQQQHPGS